MLTSEGESPADQYLRLGRSTLDLLSPVSSSWIFINREKEIVEKNEE